MNARPSIGCFVVACLMAGGTAFGQQWSGGGQPVSAMQPVAGNPVVTYLDSTQGANCPPDWGVMPASGYDGLLPEDRGFFYDHDSRFDLTWHEIVRGTWMRLEYFHVVGIERKEAGRTLGTPLATVQDVAEQFPVTFTDGVTTALAEVPTTDSIDWRNLQGIKGSFGVPVTLNYTLEASFWGIEPEEETLDVPTIPPSTLAGPFGSTNSTFLATTLTTDGQPGSRIVLYDAAFFSEYTVDIWTADVNLVRNIRTGHEGWTFHSILGYRHEEYGERLMFGGTFDNRSGFLSNTGVLANPESNLIDSKVNNFRDQIQFGFRSEVGNTFLKLGVEPKLAFGTNIVRSRVLTSDVRDPGDPNQELDPAIAVDDPARAVSYERDVLFAPSFDLGLYANIQLKEWLRFRAGYNFIWMGRLGAADSNIRFNEITTDPTTGATEQDVVAVTRTRDRLLHGFTVGGEIILP